MNARLVLGTVQFGAGMALLIRAAKWKKMRFSAY